MNPVNPAFPWPGGKRRMAPRIIAKLPAHRRYVEVFGGALAVLLQKPRSKEEIANDLNSDLVRFFRCAREHRRELLRQIALIPSAREEFEACLAQPGLTDLQRAARWFVVQTLSWGGKGQHFAAGTGTRSRRDRLANISALNGRLDRVAIEHLDCHALIERYDSAETCFFLDPPYDVGHQYDVGAWKRADHVALAERLRQVKGSWVLTYDDTPLIRELYAGCDFERHERKALMGMNHGTPTRTLAEVIITPAGQAPAP